MDYQAVIDDIFETMKGYEDTGKIATYIPELAKIDPEKFGVHLVTIGNENYGSGNSEEKFSIQSIAKVFSLTLAYKLDGKELWKRVGVEPSGTPFNSLVQLEYEKGIPRNPMINSGALVICDILISRLEHPKKELLEFMRKVSGNPRLVYNQIISNSEKATGFMNRALVNLIKNFNNIENDVEEVLDLYFNLCSVEMSCKELSRSFLFLANDGFDPISKSSILSESRSKRLNAVMQLCGFYDEAGDFSFLVGLPGKSGVGGGIVAVLPGQYSIAVWSPRLNSKGNSSKGIKFLELFTTKTESSIF